MHENVDLIIRNVRMFWQHRWVALVTAFALCSAGWVGVALMPNVYEVDSKVFLDTRSMMRPLLKGLAVDNAMEMDTALMMRRTLLVRPNLESVARKTDMDLTAKTPEDFEKLLIGLGENIKVRGTSKDNIFAITYQHRDPQTATKVVESLLNIFVEKSLGDTRKDTSKTKQFLEGQIAEYERRLIAAEERLKEFKQRNIDTLPDSEQNYYQRMNTTQEAVSNAKLSLAEAARRRDGLKSQLQALAPKLKLGTLMTGVPAAQRPPPDPLAEREQAIEKQLDQMLSLYTDKHPDVITTRRLLDEVRAQRAEQAAQAAADGSGQPGPAVRAANREVDNPIYQELTVELGKIEGEVAALEARVAEYERRAQALRQKIDTIPEVEAEFKRLARDYDVYKRNYEELVKRRESLKLSDQAGQSTDEVRFNIVDPPRVPIVPVSPNRILLSGGVLVVGLGAGVGLAWLLSLISPTVFSRRDLEALSNLPVLGAVSRRWTLKEKIRRRVSVATFAFGCVALFGLCAGLLLMYRLGIDIDGMARNLGARIL